MRDENKTMSDAARKQVICTYCLESIAPGHETVDHVIARSWYPPSIKNLSEWTVPACTKCNNRLSVVESKLLQRIALCVDTTDPNLDAIFERSRRAWSVNAARSLTDAYHRHRAKQALIRATIPIMGTNQKGMLPSSRVNYWKGSRTRIHLAKNDLAAITTKWTRGIHRNVIGSLIPPEYEISMHFPRSPITEEVRDILRYTKTISQNPYVRVSMAHVKESDQFSAIYGFNIWNCFVVHTVVIPITHEKV
ncbi:MAG: HNH endonuclease [Alphaproteobacteria bacterium]|nr:HNH endonuclease [Alphaproteobacteria bacterium]